ncbi:isochorismate synthase [Pseudoclavibacter sp. RFBG4]|uniref:isochorismate synthase n=1 Tax=Pseudoclavibacter sp. RFBG4 TaxID=2080575 RepID=UPI00280070A9|nr:isochorismate synthase [Pseudoclavibacter sp. RFBG4]
MPAVILPRLRARTIEVPDPGDLLRFASSTSPLVWLRHGDGVVATGSAWRGEFTGATRIPDSATAWRDVVGAAEIDDAAQVTGSGLIAFGAFAFAAESGARSILEVPELVVGRRGARCFVTAITADGSAPEPRLPDVAPLGDVDATATLTDGLMSGDEHRRAIDRALDLIHTGHLSKVVLAREQLGSLPEGADRRRLLARLASAYPECWTYAVDGLTGTSPETLVRVLERQVSARVLAGTAPRGSDEEADARAEARLRHSEKNLAEHRFAVESALTSLATLDTHEDPGTGLTSSRAPFTLKLPNLWHLASDIRGTLPAGVTVLDLVDALHPTAAVGGTPTPTALDAILALEPFDRQRYAGPVGWVGAGGDGEWAVALRGAEIDANGSITAYAGGGIVASSDASDEYRETQLKFRPIVEALRGDSADGPDEEDSR